MLAVFYFWLLFLVMINRRFAVTRTPFLRCFGSTLAGLPAGPGLSSSSCPCCWSPSLWIALHPLLMQNGVTNRMSSNLHLLEQGLLIGVGTLTSA